MAGEAPRSVFLHGQSPLRSYLLWEELEQDQIRYAYFLPALETPSPYAGLRYFYQNWHSAGRIPVSLRLNADLLAQNNRFGQIVQGTAQLHLTERIFLQNDFEFDSDGLQDAHFRGSTTQAFGDWTLYLQNSLLSYIYEQGHFTAGRGNIFSSVFGESILINPDFPPAEHLWWHHSVKKLSFDWVIKSLEAVNGYQRFLTLHRYAYEEQYWRIGFSEILMAGYQTLGAPQFRYLMPASFFYETEVNGGSNANLMWSFDLLAKLGACTLVGEFLVDDYALDRKSPPKLGLKLGLGYAGTIGDIYTEYVRINRWTGNYYDPELRFIENGTLIGSPLGPDTHALQVLYFKQFSDRLLTNVSVRWTESGAGDIQEWPAGIGNSANFGYHSEPFPSRPITTRYDAGLQIEYFFNSHLNTGLSVKVASVSAPLFQFHLRFAL